MMRPTVITRCAYVDDTGYGTPTRSGVWSDAGKDALHWKTIANEPFPRFGRLDALCRHAVASVELLGLDVPSEDAVDPGVAVVFHSTHGCLATDAAFIGTLSQPGGGSPKLFSYTLPSVALGEIAIRYRLGGPTLCVMSDESWSVAALWEGVDLVQSGDADACVCVSAEAVPPEATPFSGVEEPCGRFAYAFLVERADRSDATRPPLAGIAIEDDEVDASGVPLREVYEYLVCGSPGAECAFPSPPTVGAGRKLALRQAMP
ncbi:MAG: hypothetical protein GY851_01000 [bacterium]|nr:hypothetical protein [bacterium]